MSNTRFRFHPGQAAVWKSPSRFIVIEAGRRSGKTALAILDAQREVLRQRREDRWLGLLTAPTRDQAKSIFWESVRSHLPHTVIETISESNLSITMKHGNVLQVVGLDRPQRAEGRAIDKVYIDEVADMKQGVWERHLRPALSTVGRPGKAWIFGVPRFNRQFADLAEFARNPKNQPEWAYFSWMSSELLTESELLSAKSSMDPLVFAQEYEAKRVNFAGRAYHQFDRRVHSAFALTPDYNRPVSLCFDFNNSPGVAIAVQELPPPDAAVRALGDKLAGCVTCVVGEVHIPRNSNSEMVAERVVELFGSFQSTVELHGDASGGAEHTSSVQGSDWDVIVRILSQQFKSRLKRAWPSRNPPVRARINSVNARLYSANGVVGLLVCPKRAPQLIEDLDETLTLEGTSGELDKRDKRRTHASDAFGYYIHAKHPVFGGATARPLEL